MPKKNPHYPTHTSTHTPLNRGERRKMNDSQLREANKSLFHNLIGSASRLVILMDKADKVFDHPLDVDYVEDVPVLMGELYQIYLRMGVIRNKIDGEYLNDEENQALSNIWQMQAVLAQALDNLSEAIETQSDYGETDEDEDEDEDWDGEDDEDSFPVIPNDDSYIIGIRFGKLVPPELRQQVVAAVNESANAVTEAWEKGTPLSEKTKSYAKEKEKSSKLLGYVV